MIHYFTFCQLIVSNWRNGAPVVPIFCAICQCSFLRADVVVDVVHAFEIEAIKCVSRIAAGLSFVVTSIVDGLLSSSRLLGIVVYAEQSM